MVQWVYISLIVSTFIIIAGICLLVARGESKSKKPLAVVQETKATMMLCGLTYIVGYSIMVMKLIYPYLAGTDRESYLFVSAMGFVCSLVGTFVMLWTLLKKVTAYKEKVCFTTWFGSRSEMPWDSITEIKVPFAGKKITFVTSDKKFSVIGDIRQYRKFLLTAKEHISCSAVGETIDNLLRRGYNQPR